MDKFKALVDDDENKIRSWIGREGSGFYRLFTQKEDVQNLIRAHERKEVKRDESRLVIRPLH